MVEKLKTNLNKGKILIFVVLITIIGIIIYFLLRNNYKNFNIGNNISSKDVKQVEEYILNISSYEAQIEVTVDSNKNSNKYILNQKYAEPNISKQVVLQPENIEGLQTVYNGNSLIITNTKLDISTIYENYPYMTSNFLWLNSFIEDYKNAINIGNTNNYKLNEENDFIVMEVKIPTSNKYVCNKKLYIDKKTGKPTKLLIQDINKKSLVYILYNEIKLDGLPKEEVLAFKIQSVYARQY